MPSPSPDAAGAAASPSPQPSPAQWPSWFTECYCPTGSQSSEPSGRRLGEDAVSVNVHWNGFQKAMRKANERFFAARPDVAQRAMQARAARGSST